MTSGQSLAFLLHIVRAQGIIRPARRPVGWHPPGPQPTGPRQDAALWPGAGEDLCYLAGDWRILQRVDGHRWSLDDLVTAWVATKVAGYRPPERIADLGTGIGSVLLLLAWRFPAAYCLGIEAQVESADLARRSIAWNGVAHRCRVLGADLRDGALLANQAPFDLITGTPPYFPEGTATASRRPQCAPCRLEQRGGFEAYCEAAARLLGAQAAFIACAAAGQAVRARRAAEATGLAITDRLDVIPRAGKAPLFAVFVMRRAGLAAPSTANTCLVIRDAGGARTSAFKHLRDDMGMPP